MGGASIHWFCLFRTWSAWIPGSCHKIVKHCILAACMNLRSQHRWELENQPPSCVMAKISARQDGECVQLHGPTYSVCAPIPMTLSSIGPVCGG